MPVLYVHALTISMLNGVLLTPPTGAPLRKLVRDPADGPQALCHVRAYGGHEAVFGPVQALHDAKP